MRRVRGGGCPKGGGLKYAFTNRWVQKDRQIVTLVEEPSSLQPEGG